VIAGPPPPQRNRKLLISREIAVDAGDGVVATTLSLFAHAPDIRRQEETMTTSLPHSSFGNPACGGALNAITRGDQSYLVPVAEKLNTFTCGGCGRPVVVPDEQSIDLGRDTSR
jgi:hypothetical protein